MTLKRKHLFNRKKEITNN